MKTYLFQSQATVGGLPWEYRSEFPSHTMALEYGKRIALQFVGCHWFLQLVVWADPDGAQTHVGTIKLDKPTATIEVA